MSQKIEVLLDARETRRMSAGMRAYVRELSKRLPLVASDIHLRTVSHGENFSFVEQVELPFAARRAELVHFPTIFAPMVLPKRYVVTVHDLIHLRHPHLFGRSTAAYYTVFVKRLLHGAASVVVGDERTRDDCERFLQLDPGKVRVVALGYDPDLLSIPPVHAGRPYFLHVGNHRPHKDVPTLLRAWQRLPASIDLDLALTGHNDFGIPEAYGSRHLVFLGELSPADVAARIGGATALVQPSLAEGFGLPVLEALVRRVPAIAADDAFPQIFRDNVARFPAGDVDALAALMEEVATTPVRMKKLALEGETAARAYTWDRFASAIATVYREALGVLHV